MKNILILFGCTGDIYIKKVYSSLYNLHNHTDNGNFISLCLGRKKINEENFSELIKKGLKKDVKNFDNFFRNFEYKDANYNDNKTYEYIIRFIRLNYNNNDKIIFYFGIPAFATLEIMKKINEFGIHKIKNSFFLIEKPFGDSLNQFINYCRDINFEANNINNNILFIDHYRAKNKLIHLKHNIRSYYENILKKITIEIYESLDVDNRVSYFENYGLINDMFQSHILSMLQYILGENFYLHQLPIIKDLEVKQYENYPINNSTTETYFNVLLVWNNIDINIICGKKMNQNKRLITFEYLNSENKVYDFTESRSSDYFNLFDDVIRFNGKNLFLSYSDNINFWNITNNMLLFKEQTNMKYY